MQFRVNQTAMRLPRTGDVFWSMWARTIEPDRDIIIITIIIMSI